MEITRVGHSCFKLRGRQTTIISDPFDPKTAGIKFPKMEADIVTVSHNHPDHNYVKGVSGAKVVVSGPGEYEIKGVNIIGVPTGGKNTAYRILIDGINIVHLGDLGHKLEDSQKEVLSESDILLIPIGGTSTIDHHEASEVVSQLEPSIVIPMLYKDISPFLKEMGKEGITPVAKLNITRDKLPSETTVVVLE